MNLNKLIKEFKITDKSNENQENKIRYEVIKALGMIISAKDNFVCEHTGRVVYYSKKLAKALNLDEERTYWLEIGAFLHDIGKVGIPDNILNKHGALTEEEYDYMKKHPEIGKNIISEISCLQNSLDAIITHQERYDGRGYPMGLKGDEIPEIGRILAIADAFDAMTSDRSYRKALSMEQAIEELKKNKGTQFDPNFVDQFIKILYKNNKDRMPKHTGADLYNEKYAGIPQKIDYTLIGIDVRERDIERLCSEAIRYHMLNVCVSLDHVELAKKLLKDSNVGIVTMIGSNYGSTTKVKLLEVEEAINSGATEIEVMMDIGKLKDENYEYIKNDLTSIINFVDKRVEVKIVIEMALLNDGEKIKAMHIVKECGANFIKTSAGFISGGAVKQDVKLVESILGKELKIKVSADVSTLDDIVHFIEAGVDRIGTKFLFVV